jgi:hypothetical protein
MKANARFQPPLKAGATQERTLEVVGCKPLLGGGSSRQPWIKRCDSQGCLVLQDQSVCRL